MFSANSGACVGSGMPAAAPAAEAACLPRLAIGDRLECIALFGEANGVMLLGNEARPTKVSKGRGLSGVFGRERNLALAAGDDALPFGLAALNLAPAAGAARDVPAYHVPKRHELAPVREPKGLLVHELAHLLSQCS